MKNDFLLISGRPGSGKTELLICYANRYLAKTLVLSEESTKIQLQERGLNKRVVVVGKNEFGKIDINEFDTICIDYIELFERNFINDVLVPLKEKDIRIIAISQMAKDGEIKNNLFEKLFMKGD